MYRYKDLLNEKCRRILCSALVQCHFDYCCSAWFSSLGKVQKKKLQTVQNRIVKFILNLHFRTHIGQKILDQVKMLNVEDRARQLQLNHVYKIYRGDCPNYMQTKFDRIRDMQQRTNTRASINNFFLPRVEKEASKSFYFTAMKSRNVLPENINILENKKKN